MSGLSAFEARTRNFYDWELQGRGWRAYSYPVALEPLFRPFPGHYFPAAAIDDGRKPTFLSSIVDRLTGRNVLVSSQSEPETIDHHSPQAAVDEGVVSEWEILVPLDEKIDPAVSEAWLRTAAAASGPLSFELVGFEGRVSIRLAVKDRDVAATLGQLRAFLPFVSVRSPERSVLDLWSVASGDVVAAVEFGLAREFVIPLRTAKDTPDPLTPFVGALAQVESGEVALLQVLFEQSRAPWAANALRAVLSPDGKPFFIDAPEITDLAQEKCSAPLYPVALRIALQCQDDERAWAILRNLVGALSQYNSPDRNELVPLAADDLHDLIDDILSRRTRRSGMILSLPELASLVRLPGQQVKTQALVRTPAPQEMLPTEVLGTCGATLGQARHKGAMVPVRISADARMQHVYVIGASGTGKSTLLERLILDDIAAGAGVGVLDPHGDLVDDILGRIPADRINDVVLFDPTDPDITVGWNILGAHSDIERELLASDLVSVFRRLSTSWGDQMSVVLGNAVMAFLESNRGGSLIDLRRFLLDDAFRANFLATVRDPHVVSFWRDEYPLLIGKRPQAPILTRLDIFLRSRLVRRAVTQQEGGLNFRSLIDDGKIFLAKLSQGAIGEENAALLGSLLVSKFHQVSLSRQDTALEARRPFYLFIDEFQQVATPSMAGLFSGLRKYRLGVTIAHHDLYQLHANAPEVERAVLTNAYTRVFFRVSDEDARRLEKGLGSFTAEDLTRLGRGEAICRIEQRDQAFRLQTLPLNPVPSAQAEKRRGEVRAASIAVHGRATELPEPTPEQPARQALEEAVSERPPAPSEPRPASPVSLPSPGRGGPIHKYLQGVIKEWGRTAGFRVEIEHQLPGGQRIDVALLREGLSIACEIAGTTSIEQEIGNIEKCLAADFQHVVAVSLDAAFLRRLDKALSEKMESTTLERVSLCSPEELLTLLKSCAAGETRHGRIAGYNVTVRHQESKTGDAEDRRRTIAEVMLKSVRRLREKRP